MSDVPCQPPVLDQSDRPLRKNGPMRKFADNVFFLPSLFHESRPPNPAPLATKQRPIEKNIYTLRGKPRDVSDQTLPLVAE